MLIEDTMDIEIIFEKIPLVKRLYCIDFIYQLQPNSSFASAIVSANLLYKPGIYFVYGYNQNQLRELLYVGKAGADKDGVINTHQLPKRLLGVCYPPAKYLKKIKSKHPNRNYAWPIMMQIDNIDTIKVFCFYSKINNNQKVDMDSNPLILERQINQILKQENIKPLWSK